MTRLWRISDRATFAALRREGRRARHGSVVVTWLPSDDAGRPRVAFAVGRRVGTAVARNRVRRRLRQAVVARAQDLAPGAYLVAVTPAAAEASYDELRDDVQAAVRAATAASAPAGAEAS